MSSVPSPPAPASRDSTPPGPFMTLYTAIILLTALDIGLVVGGLTYLGGTSAADAVLAGLLGAGGSVPVLRSLIG
ncbi:hypothetical protein [Streptomyces sp. NPDC058739]|uniref:hypothetical protein n=1 Tax=Streptomyces sp. NPDC058739 TaxID=3346618 RepID=UPI0036778CC8